MNGWTGTILKVNLSAKTAQREAIPQPLLEEYLGGRGLGVRLMRDHFRLAPSDPDLPLIFAVGPLCGTSAPTAARLSVISRSPLTGTIYDCSAGGRFAWRLKAAGLDCLVVTGRSPEPVVLAIRSDGVEILPAGHLWGKAIPATVDALKERGSVAAIGPAGENGVPFASIMMGEGNSVGRGGLGAVMGAKNLKGVVVDGDRVTAIADPAPVRQVPPGCDAALQGLTGDLRPSGDRRVRHAGAGGSYGPTPHGPHRELPQDLL